MTLPTPSHAAVALRRGAAKTSSKNNKTSASESLPDRKLPRSGGGINSKDLAGDGDHYKARIISSAFNGKSRVAQHQLVYRALKGKMGGELHALALETEGRE